MAVYLKEFSTHSEYEQYINGSGAILPNVSICTTEGDVHYKPSSPTPSHDFVEIGGVKWATMNVGANSVTDYGLYFQWGDTQGYTADQVGSEEGKKCFLWEDYKWGETCTKYNETDGKVVLDIEDDAARAAWGGSWRMPTTAEFQALGNAVNTAWTADYQGSGVAGMICTDKTDSSKTLFFPACGYCDVCAVCDVGFFGNYWSSSLDSSYIQDAYCMGFTNRNPVDWQGPTCRNYGFPVRGVFG